MEDMVPTSHFDTLPDEATLLARMRAGEQDAFEACVRAYCTQLLIVARRILRNEEDAKDAVQEAFLAAFKDLTRFEGRSLLATWLHRIVVNAALTRLRSRQRHPEQSIEALIPHFGEDEHQVEPPALWKDLADSSSQRREARELVHKCINQLPEIYRTVLLLRDIEGLDTEETARLLDTSAGVVKTRLHRARQGLRTLLDPHYRRGDV
jgi:RNA polymerase sigma-70 factor (ECF subfamily)